jgi:tagatose 1,6-diphosphate aldolase
VVRDEIKLHLTEKNPGDEHMLPFHYFDIVRTDAVVGKVSLRFGNNFHSYYNGHVGFEIYPEYRGNNYAFQAVTQILDVAKKHGMDEIYLTCKQSNAASRRIFDKLGAEFIEVVKIPPECFFYRDGIEEYTIYRLPI